MSGSVLFRRCRGRVKNCASGCWGSGGINCLERRFGRKRSSLPQKRESREKKNWILVSTGMTHNEADQSTERTRMAPRSAKRGRAATEFPIISRKACPERRRRDAKAAKKKKKIFIRT